MYLIATDQVTEWASWSGHWCPKSIDMNCGHCGRLTNFPIVGGGPLELTKHSLTIIVVRECPGCGKKVKFFILEPGPANDTSKTGCEYIAVSPVPHKPREALSGSEMIPSSIFKAYMDVVNVFNSKVWTATATCCRRTLEAMMLNVLPEEKCKGSLASQIRSLANDVDLHKPLLHLSDSIRKAGNLGAHFDEDMEPDEHTALAMLDLIEYLMEYLFILPKQIEGLDSRLEFLKAESTGTETSGNS